MPAACGFRAIAIPILCGALFGCGTRVYPVAGRVTLDGKPLGGAVVSFVPDEGRGRPAFSYTRDDGSFDLNTFTEADGAHSGAYKILVMKTANSPDQSKSSPETPTSSATPSATNLVPAGYSDVMKTPFACIVPTTAPLVLELSSKGP